MVKNDERELYDSTIEAYSSLMKSKEKSIFFKFANECLIRLEYFEEFEKCKDLVSIFPELKSAHEQE